MKKVLLMAVMAVLLSSCSKEQKCKSLIKDYLSKNLDDFSSYASVEFSKIIPDSTLYYDDEIYKKINDSIKIFERKRGDDPEYIIDTVDLPLGYYSKLADSIILYMDKEQNFIRRFKKTQKGWLISHKFRSKENGNLKLHIGYFHFNMDCTKVELADIEKIKEDNKNN